MGNQGKIILAKCFEKFPKVSKFRPIWSHWLKAWFAFIILKYYLGVFTLYEIMFHWSDRMSKRSQAIYQLKGNKIETTSLKHFEEQPALWHFSARKSKSKLSPLMRLCSRESGKLLCLWLHPKICSTSMASFHTYETIGPIMLFISLYFRAPWISLMLVFC